MPTTIEASSNFILPNATFIVELIIFFALFGLVAKFIVPAVSRSVAQRQELLRQRADEARQAKEQMAAAEADYRNALAEARRGASKIREEAREEGAAAIAEARRQANEEARGIIEAAQRDIAEQRQRAFDELRGEIGTLAAQLAGRILGESLPDDVRRSEIIERFLADLEHGKRERVS